MAVQFTLIGLVVADLDASLDFYRRLGIDVPADNGTGHVQATLPGGIELAWDTIETIHSFDPEWQPPTGGHRAALSRTDCRLPVSRSPSASCARRPSA